MKAREMIKAKTNSDTKSSKMKAQVFTADAIAASAVIIIAIGLALFVHELMLNEINYSYSSSMVDRTTQVLMNQVASNISTNAAINSADAKKLFSKTYSDLSSQFGVSYNFSIRILNAQTRRVVSLDSTPLSAGLSYKKPSVLSTAEWFAVLNNNYVVIQVKVFE